VFVPAVARGQSVNQIAENLKLAPSDRPAPTLHIKQKLGVQTQSRATFWPVSHGTDDPDTSQSTERDEIASSRPDPVPHHSPRRRGLLKRSPRATAFRAISDHCRQGSVDQGGGNVRDSGVVRGDTRPRASPAFIRNTQQIVAQAGLEGQPHDRLNMNKVGPYTRLGASLGTCGRGRRSRSSINAFSD